MSKVTYTPMIQQYLKIKEDYGDAVVFFRLGDFYEMFFDDAILASKILEIQLTSRDAGTKVPMCGVPYHASRVYIQKLVDKGLKIAVAEQVSEPGKGLVERKVTRIITPGTIYEEDILHAHANNYIGSIFMNDLGYQLSYVDISTGDAFIKEGLSSKKIIQSILDLNIKEIVLSQFFDQQLIEQLNKNHILLSEVNITEINHKALKTLDTSSKQGVIILLSYLVRTQEKSLELIEKFEKLNQNDLLLVDDRVKKHLEIFSSLQNSHDKTLISLIDHTKTAAGSRLLKHYLNYPVTSLETLSDRHMHIEAFMKSFAHMITLEDALLKTYDVSRIVGRVIFGSATPRDLFNLKKSLEQLPSLVDALSAYQLETTDKLVSDIDLHEDLYYLLDQAIEDNPPLNLKEGGYIKHGYSEKLDALRILNTQGDAWLEAFELSEKERTGIRNLKVGFSKNYGYYIEISKAQSELVKDEFGYERKQTLVNNERFVSPVLKDKEEELLHAAEYSIELETLLFNDVRNKVLTYQTSLSKISHTLAFIDVFLNFARIAQKNSYVKPILSIDDRDVEIIDGRHPVVENYTTFVQNDIKMKEHEIFIITGPNMSGKSTYMRMFALIVYMAQIGSFVPASYAKMPIYDALYTRIGSSDDLTSGKSTFMVEMVESNEALSNATHHSLIVFDEIGRGTATFDGMALAAAMIEYIYNQIGAQTLFSTHYHEITSLADQYTNITNLHVKASLSNGNITFLHQIQEGASDRSYGVLVAKLANLPKEVIRKSQKILKQLESQKAHENNLFTYQNDVVENEFEASLSIAEEVIEQLLKLDVNKMTPVDALVFLNATIKHIKSSLKEE